jgi:WD40 repeat protein
VLKASVLNSSQSIPTWQELIDGKEWVQCSPATCAKLDIDAKNPNAVIDAARYRHLALESGSIGNAQLPHPIKIEPYLAPARADDIAMLNTRVHDSLPEWDVTGMQQVVNSSLASKYAAYRHRVAARCNGNPNERMMFHFADPAVMTKIWQQGEGHDPRLSIWAEVGNGAYFAKHAMYGYAYKYQLWPSPPGFTVKPEPPIGESMQVFVSLVCLGNVADVGPGCETCTSPAWEAWKKEPPVMPKPTRPPAMTLPADAAEKQHVLDLMQVKDAPRCDSVMSTEGELGTHISSTSKDASGRRICDIMHPRLRARAKEWAEQCVLFETAASYPMFIVTLTKTRDSPMGPQQLMDAGCDPNRIKALGFTASHVKALGKNTREMRAAGWSAPDMKGARFDAGSLLAGGYSISELKSANFSALHMKDAGCSAQQLKSDFTLEELKATYDIPALRSAGYSLPDMKGAGFSASSLKAVGCSAQELKDAEFTASDLRNAGFDLAALDQAGFSTEELKGANFTDAEISQTATFASAEAAMQSVRVCFAALKALGVIDAVDQRQAEDLAGKDFFKRVQICVSIDDLMDALRHSAIFKNRETAQSLRVLGVSSYCLHAAGFSQTIIAAAGYGEQVQNCLRCDSSVPSALSFVYKHHKILLAAFFAALTSMSIGLGLGDSISMMFLVVCLPTALAFAAHWRGVTKDGSKYPVKSAVGFAVYFIAVFSLSMGIMLGMPPKLHGMQAAIVIFAVVIPIIMLFASHYVYWSSANIGAQYPFKYQKVFALVLACFFMLSLGLFVGLRSSPREFSFMIATSDRKAGKTDVAVTFSFTPSVFGSIAPGGTITLTYPDSIFLPSVAPYVSGSNVAGLTATCGATTATSVVITTAGATIPSASAFSLTLRGFTFESEVNPSVVLATGSNYNRAIVWNISSGSSLYLNPYLMSTCCLDPIRSVAWSPDGSKIATASDDGTIWSPWSSSSGSLLLSYTGHSDSVSSVAWSPDGSKIATASWDGTARVWSSSSGSTLLTLTGHRKAVSSVAWSPDGSKIVTGSQDSTARVWSSSSGSTLLMLTGHGGNVYSVAWSPDGSKIVTGSQDSTARVWSSSSGSMLLMLTGHGGSDYYSGSVSSVAWSPDGSKIVTGSQDGTARVWSSSSGSTLLTYTGHSSFVNSVAWSPDGSKIVTGSTDSTARVWSSSNGSTLLTLDTGYSSYYYVNSVAWSPSVWNVTVQTSSDKIASAAVVSGSVSL